MVDDEVKSTGAHKRERTPNTTKIKTPPEIIQKALFSDHLIVGTSVIECHAVRCSQTQFSLSVISQRECQCPMCHSV